MDAEELKQRTKRFALCVIQMAESIPQTVVSRRITDQLVRAGTSVGANYRASCRARSRAEFNSKLQTVQEEADESAYWIEVLLESNLVSGSEWVKLHQEADELTAIFTSSLITSRGLR
ncbi:MAG: four helix bundle protein [Ignavibacteriales bacterium]|nr:four helix bundle protein [Ignavibacteriales bacterium]MBI3005648.1 four helix bundle protein [Ignavibacteriales bacterium]